MILGGVDPSTESFNLALLSDKLYSWERVSLGQALDYLACCDLVIIEVPDTVNVGFRLNYNLVQNLGRVEANAKSLQEMLERQGVKVRLASARDIRRTVFNWSALRNKSGKGKADAYILNWMRAVHLPGELKLAQGEIKKMLGRGGELGTVDRRDSYGALLYGQRLISSGLL